MSSVGGTRFWGLAALFFVAVLGCSAPAAAPTPDVPATVEAEVGTRVSARVAVIPATVVAQVATQVAGVPTATAYPTYTPYPTYTLYPTATLTPVPTATKVPTATPRPTATAVPTATVRPTNTPRPTRTPRPTVTPTPVVRWGLPSEPVLIKDLVRSDRVRTGRFIFQGCYTGVSESEFGFHFLFSEDGEFASSSRFVLVRGFKPEAFMRKGRCYNMGVEFRGVKSYCYGYTGPSDSYPPRIPRPFEENERRYDSGCGSGWWLYRTPVYDLVHTGAWERR